MKTVLSTCSEAQRPSARNSRQPSEPPSPKSIEERRSESGRGSVAEKERGRQRAHQPTPMAMTPVSKPKANTANSKHPVCRSISR